MQRPQVGAPAHWDFPSPVATQLDNGLEVLFFERPGQHLIATTLVLDLPLTSEPAAIEGVSAIVQRCLDEGTRTHPGTTFADALEGRGAVLTGGSSHTAAHLSLEVPSTRFASALPLFVEAVAEPQLSDADIERHVGLRLAEIAQQSAHPAHRSGLAFRAAAVDRAFRASRPAAGSAETVAPITADDVRAHFGAHYGPQRGTLIVAGQFDADPMPLVADAFGRWRQPSVPVAQETPRGTSPTTLLIHRPGAVQADVRIGRFGLDRRNPDYAALRLGCFVLGGGFLSRLNRVLREERGYTYGVQLANTPARSGGLLTLHGSFRTEVAVAAITEALELLRVDPPRQITEPELRDAVNFLVGVTPLRSATAGGLADQVATLVEAGLGAGFMNTHAAELNRVSAEQATAAIARNLPADGVTLVVVGDADVLADPLTATGLDVDIA